MIINMVRLFKYLLVTLAFSGAMFASHRVYAQSTGPSPLPTPSQTNSVSAASLSAQSASAPIASDKALPLAQIVTTTAPTTGVVGSTGVALPIPTAIPTVAITQALNSPLAANVALTSTSATTASSGPLEGTILANRSA